MLLILLSEQSLVLQNQGTHVVTRAARPCASPQHSSAARMVMPFCLCAQMQERFAEKVKIFCRIKLMQVLLSAVSSVYIPASQPHEFAFK